MPGIGDIVSALQSMPDPSADVNNAVAEFQARQQQGVQLQQQHAQIVRQLGLQRQADTAQQAALANPTPENITRWGIAAPDQYQAIKEAHAQLTADQQNQNLRDMSATYGYLQAGNKDAARALVKKRIDADSKAGRDTTDDTAFLAQIDSDPKAAAGIAGLHLAASLGPDKFAEGYGKLGSEARDNQEEPGKQALTAAQTAEAQANAGKAQAETQTTLHPNPETAVAPQPDANGNPVYYNPKAAPPAGSGAGGSQSTSPALAALIPKLISSESGFDPNAKNPKSTATGLGQFVQKTWLEQVKAQRPDLANGKTDAQILALRSDPNLSTQILTGYAQQNAATLAGASLPVNGATIAMASKLGPGGAQAVLRADPNAKLSTVLSPEAIAANPQLGKLTAGQYAAGLVKQFGTDPINASADPSATGDDYLATLPPARARLVRAIANGDQAGPTGRAATTGPGLALMQQVLQYDPTATAMALPVRKATAEAFTHGAQGQAINSANTLIGHAVTLRNAIAGLNNGNIGALNWAAQGVETALGNTGKQTALAHFNTARGAFAAEMVKVLRGSGGAESDVKYWLKQLDPSRSPSDLTATVDTGLDLMQSRLESLAYEKSTGMQKHFESLDLLSPHAKAQLASIGAQSAAAAPQVAVDPRTGHKVVFDVATNSWKPQ